MGIEKHRVEQESFYGYQKYSLLKIQEHTALHFKAMLCKPFFCPESRLPDDGHLHPDTQILLPEGTGEGTAI
jgi:hypothetical protein